MRVDTQGEFRVGVSEVLGDGVGLLTGVDEYGGIEVLEGVHAVAASRFDVTRGKGESPSGAPQVHLALRPPIDLYPVCLRVIESELIPWWYATMMA